MNRTELSCDREADVLEILSIDAWPARADAALTDHAAECPVCRDLVLVFTALGRQTTMTLDQPRLPDSQLVWHRAQMRARQDATRRAARPVLFAEISAVAIVTMVLAMWAGGAESRLTRGASTAWSFLMESGSRVQTLSRAVEAAASSAAESGGLPVGLGWTLLAGIGIGLALVLTALGVSRLADRGERL